MFCLIFSLFSFNKYKNTGNVQTFITPHSIYYTLEVWGARGHAADSNGGKGGYAFGYKYLSAGVSIFICNGQAGYHAESPFSDKKTYNGGGAGQQLGGGCTHIAATNRGELYNYESYKSEVWLVAGGGGGSDYGSGSGGHGGGSVGNDSRNNGHTTIGGLGGTQTAGGTGGYNGSFGRGGNSIGLSGTDTGGSGGGGWYGGGGCTTTANGGGGGSGHIGSVTNGIMKTGIWGDNGKTLITWMPVL